MYVTLRNETGMSSIKEQIVAILAELKAKPDATDVLEKLTREATPLVTAITFRRLGHCQPIDEICVASVYKAFRSISRFDPLHEYATGWFPQIVTNCIWDFLRKNRKPNADGDNSPPKARDIISRVAEIIRAMLAKDNSDDLLEQFSDMLSSIFLSQRFQTCCQLLPDRPKLVLDHEQEVPDVSDKVRAEMLSMTHVNLRVAKMRAVKHLVACLTGERLE